ncbi:uncharacterized protein DS421_8g231430 [Arachis hypogaea]|nr:uncharacterized protein DS421_8g231430 [Arachis hypogaea]
MPANPSCMTPSPPGKQISLGNAGTEQQYTQCTPIKVHPLLKGRKIDEDDEERVRRWAANGSLEQSGFWRPMKEGSIYLCSDRTSAHCCPGTGSPATSFSGCVQHSMTPNHCGLRMTFTETVLQKRNLASFREDPTVSYVGLGPHFGDDSIFFDKIAASMQKWWFAPVCIDCHWWLYAFEIAQKRLWVLDSMNTGVPNNERVKLHAYAARLIEDMAKVSMPAYEHTENGLPVSMLASHNKITGHCDCGVFVIKFMQFWGLDKSLQHWDQDIVQEFRKEIILDIVMGPHNSEIGKVLQALESNHVRRNQPRKKSKAVKSPFTAPSTKSMLQRAGLPTRKPRKGGRQRK